MMTRVVAAVTILVGGAAPALPQEDAPQPSFDCTGATQAVERLICSDPALADLDRALGESYDAALASGSGEARAALRAEQRAWTRNRSSACGIEDDPPADAARAAGCLAALYRARLGDLQPGEPSGPGAPRQSGYGWLMGDWTVGAIRTAPPDDARAEAARAQVGRLLHFAEAPIATLGGAACSFPRYHAEPSPGPEFGDLTEYPAAVMVRVTCVGIALLDIVRLTDDRIMLGEGAVVFELERRR